MVTLSKIYTRGGDAGETSLGDGSRRRKDDLRVEAYGTVDEANATLGLVRLHTSGAVDALLSRVQNDLFDLGADLCTPEGDERRSGALAGRGCPGRRAGGRDRPLQRAAGDAEELHPPRRLAGGGLSAPGPDRHAARRAAWSSPWRRRRASEPGGGEVPEPLCPTCLFVLGRHENDGGASDVLWVPGANR
jgi:cob(I)alamin adenosyltransferase